MTITEFLEARLTEDEVSATLREIHRENCGWVPDESGYSYPCDCGIPERMAAECAAKRAIIKLHKTVKYTLPNHADEWPLEYWHDSDGLVTVKKDGRVVERMRFEDYCERFGIFPNPPDKELLALAAVYKDHPDYDERWAA